MKTKNKPKIIALTVIGRRWFQKSYGNTYHTVKVYINGDLVHTSDKQYGYGEQYIDTAKEWLIKSGWIEDSGRPLWTLRDTDNVIWHYEAVDVNRERDL